MIFGLNPAILALKAYDKKLDVTANNISNVNTDGFKKSRTLFQEAFPSGVTASVNRVNRPAPPIIDGKEGRQTGERSNVDIGEETVQLITTGHAYTANLKTVKTENETLGTLLDLVD